MQIQNFLKKLMKKPASYYCHKENIESNLDSSHCILKTIEKIGEGAFGQVYKVFDPKTSRLLVLKKQKNNNKKGMSRETSILKQMSSSQGFAKLDHVQTQKQDQYVVMSYLGFNLGHVCSNYQKISVYSMKRIAIQLVRRLKELHNHKYIHRDLKPENILLGNQNDPHTVYLVDFGLATGYRAIKKSSKPRKMYEGLIGTARYCSIAAHQGLQQFPKDDVQSLGYILIYITTGTLGWKVVTGQNQQQRFNRILSLKKTLAINQLCAGINCLKKYFSYVKALDPSQQIDYGFLQNIFKVDSKDDYCFEFCNEQCKYKVGSFKGTKSNFFGSLMKQQQQLETVQENIPNKKPFVGIIRQFTI